MRPTQPSRPLTAVGDGERSRTAGAGTSAPSDTPPALLAARLAVPQPVPRYLERPRLAAMLDVGTQRPLTVVHAPAGSGKTLLVAGWARDHQGPVAWVTLDSDADGPGTFWSYVLQALDVAGLALRARVGTPARADEVDRSMLARLAAELSELDGPVVLVLDDYDRVSPGPVDRELDYVLRNAAPVLRLVVVARRRPALRLPRYRVAGGLQEIGPADLAFPPGEAVHLLRLHGVPQPPDVVDDLVARTDGWATGLRLSAIALEHGVAPEDLGALLSSAHGEVAEFLLAEIVDELPPPTRDLLVRASVLDRVTGDLADALTGRSDGQPILEEMAASGSFVRVVPGTSGWYRFHDLLAAALRGRLESHHPELVPELHRRASRWLADHDWLAEAVAHATAAADWQLAADEIVDALAVGDLLVGLETRRLTRLLEAMPPDHSHTATMAIVQAAMAQSRFDAPACVRALDRAEAMLGDVPEDRRAAAGLAVAAVRVIVSRLTGDVAGGTAAGRTARSLATQVAPQRLAERPELMSLVLSSLGTLQLWSGAAEEAEQTLHEGVATSVGPGTEASRSNCLGQLAFVHYLRGRLREAHRRATESLAVAEQAGISTSGRVPVGHLAAAAVAWEWDDLSAVTMHVELAASSVAAKHDPSFAVLVAQYQARCRMAHGDHAGAVHLLLAARPHRERLLPSSFLAGPVTVDAAMALLALGDVETARTTLDQLPEGPERRLGTAQLLLRTGDPAHALDVLADLPDDVSLPPGLAIRARLAAAEAWLLDGDTAAAKRHVEQALQLARPERFRRPFAESASWWRRAVGDDLALLRSNGWLGTQLTGMPPGGPGTERPPMVVEPLTEKELEVLRLSAQPMTSREVAEAMHLSVNTVKTHLRSVYRKLSASGRNDAVRRARALGIL